LSPSNADMIGMYNALAVLASTLFSQISFGMHPHLSHPDPSCPILFHQP